MPKTEKTILEQALSNADRLCKATKNGNDPQLHWLMEKHRFALHTLYVERLADEQREAKP
jgi:hypothetical protein